MLCNLGLLFCFSDFLPYLSTLENNGDPSTDSSDTRQLCSRSNYGLDFRSIGFSIRVQKIRKYVAFGSIILCGILLNVSFLWTSGLIDYNIPIYNQPRVDYLLISILFVFMVSVFYLWRSLTRMIQLAALVMLPLGIEIFLFVRDQLFLHVANFQAGTPITFFNNFDLIVSCLALLSISAILGRFASKK